MEQLKVTIQNSKPDIHYPIIIGKDILNKINSFVSLDSYSKIVVISDSNVSPLWFSSLKKALGHKLVKVVIPAGEKNKSLANMQRVWKKVLECKLDRKSLIINLGGGVVCDLGGFVAATYMRGIDFLQIPTTVLAQVDASIGGKVAVNFGGIKNSIGVFAQPVAVCVDIATLSTLPKREFVSGFAEIVKHGLIQSRSYFDFVTSKKPQAFSQKELIEIMKRSIQIKKAVVAEDEKEAGLRKILNFGHTVGHALETLSLESKKPLLHGEAVAIGMIAEAKLSELIGLISRSSFQKIERTLQDIGLPIRFKGSVLIANIVKIMKQDKKSISGDIRLVLLKRMGEAGFDHTVSPKVLKQALNYILS